MKEIRPAITKGIYAALTAVTDTQVYTRMQKAANIAYPYIHVGDIYVEENGTKDQFMYKVDVLFNVVYKDQTSLTAFYADIDNVKSLINNDVPFEIDTPFTILECALISDSTTEFEDSDGAILNVGAVRALFTCLEG